MLKSKINILKIKKIKRIHFVGIGGVGMSGIAFILFSLGYEITGSDILRSSITDKLIKLGIKIFFRHKEENIQNASMLVVSGAISLNNPEVISAKKYQIPVISRAEMLNELMQFYYGIAISGTHGKTTTTSMVVSIYKKAGLDPTFINGGLIKSEGMYANLGNSKYFIAEADESDGSFLYLDPLIVIVTNIEKEHMDFYEGNFEKLKNAFVQFLNNLPFYGLAILCIDDPVIRSILPKIKCFIVTYGFSFDADIRIKNYKQFKGKSFFIISRKNEKDLNLVLNIPGKHNALNAAAAIALSIKQKIRKRTIIKALKEFQGTMRRFDFLGNFSLEKINGKKGFFMLIDDYGHHPTEIKVTLETARKSWPNKRIIMVFQPHRYTRTRDLYYDFIKILEKVDVLLILNIFSAGENIIPNINSQLLCEKIRNRGKLNPIFISNFVHVKKILKEIIKANDLIFIQGAGNIERLANDLVKSYFNFKLKK